MRTVENNLNRALYSAYWVCESGTAVLRLSVRAILELAHEPVAELAASSFRMPRSGPLGELWLIDT